MIQEKLKMMIPPVPRCPRFVGPTSVAAVMINMIIFKQTRLALGLYGFHGWVVKVFSYFIDFIVIFCTCVRVLKCCTVHIWFVFKSSRTATRILGMNVQLLSSYQGNIAHHHMSHGQHVDEIPALGRWVFSGICRARLIQDSKPFFGGGDNTA